MSTTAQQKANYRARLEQRGFKRFEVTARATDQDLLRTLARRLTEDGPGPDADRTRSAVRELVTDESSKPGGILLALRRSPLVGANLKLSRERVNGRRIDL